MNNTSSRFPKTNTVFIGYRLQEIKHLFTGGIGYFSPKNNMDTCIALRTAIVKNNKVYIQAGAGIVADSNPEKEYQETLNKAKALIEASK